MTMHKMWRCRTKSGSTARFFNHDMTCDGKWCSGDSKAMRISRKRGISTHSIATIFVGVAATIQYLSPASVLGYYARVAAEKHLSAFCHHQKSMIQWETKQYVSYPTLAGHVVTRFRERGHRLHALEISPYAPRGCSPSHGENNSQENVTRAKPLEFSEFMTHSERREFTSALNLENMPLFEAPAGLNAPAGTPNHPIGFHVTRDESVVAGITLLFSLVVLAVFKFSPGGCWRYYLAGGICASTSHAITTPIDVVKVRNA